MKLPPPFTALLFLLCPLAAQAECNAEAVDYSVAQSLVSLHCSAAKARKALFTKTFYVYAVCFGQDGKELGAYLTYDSNSCLRIAE